MTAIIHFDYDFSPYGQKTKLLLHAAGIDFQKCDQPVVLPRPDLEALGITYRRIPLLAIGKDIYADSSLITSVILTQLLNKTNSSNLALTPADLAYQTWGDRAFDEILGLIPLAALTPSFVRDRATVFPIVQRADLATLRPSAVAGFRSRLRQVEDVFLAGGGGGPFMHGAELSLADIHVVWALRWALQDLGAGKEVGCGREDFPKVWRMIESLPTVAPRVMSGEETIRRIKDGEFTAEGPLDVAKDDPYGIAKGTQVTIESFDTVPGSHPQVGKLLGANIDEVVIEVNDGVRLHFPRIGYIVRPQQNTARL